MYSNKTLRGFRVSFPKIVVFHWLDYSRYTLKPSETVLSINPKVDEVQKRLCEGFKVVSRMSEAGLKSLAENEGKPVDAA